MYILPEASMKCDSCCLRLVIAFALTPALSGCSMLALISGSQIDYANQGGPDVDDLRDIGKLKSGQPVVVTRQNGDTLQGAYFGLFPRSSREYNAVLDSAESSLGETAHLPRYGEPVKVVTEREGVTSAASGIFEGFDPTCIYVRVQGSPDRLQLSQATIVSVIDTSGRLTEGESIRRWQSRGSLPSVWSMRLARADSTVTIPLEDISGIENSVKSNVGIIGFAVGAVFDIGLIALIASGGMFSW